jgi:hypothetical protein
VMKLTVQKTRIYRSTRVPSSAMVKIRSPFLATDNGMATNTVDSFQEERIIKSLSKRKFSCSVAIGSVPAVTVSSFRKELRRCRRTIKR